MIKKLLGQIVLFLIIIFSFQSTLPANSTSTITITGAGSTFAQVILQDWANQYQSISNGTIQLSYGGGGSGQGIKAITNQSVDFGASDAPLTLAQRQAINTNANSNGHFLGKINTIPESAGGIVLAYNLPKSVIQGPLNLTGVDIAKIFQGSITFWNDSLLKKDNPGLTSNAGIMVFHRNDASGTTFAFSDYLARSAPNTWNLGTGTTLNWPSRTIGANGNEGLSTSVTSMVNSIGYVELAYAIQKNIPNAFIENRDGNWVNASLPAITNAVNFATAGLPDSTADWSSVSLNDQSGASTYPICTLTYLFVYGNLTEYGSKGVALINFLKYIMTPNAQALANGLGYVPLPQNLLSKNLDVINAIEVSSLTTPSSNSLPGFGFLSPLIILAFIPFLGKKHS